MFQFFSNLDKPINDIIDLSAPTVALVGRLCPVADSAPVDATLPSSSQDIESAIIDVSREIDVLMPCPTMIRTSRPISFSMMFYFLVFVNVYVYVSCQTRVGVRAGGRGVASEARVARPPLKTTDTHFWIIG